MSYERLGLAGWVAGRSRCERQRASNRMNSIAISSIEHHSIAAALDPAHSTRSSIANHHQYHHHHKPHRHLFYMLIG